MDMVKLCVAAVIWIFACTKPPEAEFDGDSKSVVKGVTKLLKDTFPE